MGIVFDYHAKDGKAKDVRGQIEAASQDEAINKLDGQGLVVVSVKQSTRAVTKEAVEAQITALGDFHQFFTRKEIDYLPEVLNAGETIQALTSGHYDGNTWLIVVTDKRLLFLDKGMVYGGRQVEIPLSQISASSSNTGLMFGEIGIATAGGSKTIGMIPKEDVAKVSQIISNLINKTPGVEALPKESNDTIAQLERLAELKKQGILTEEEFQQQKKKLLS